MTDEVTRKRLDDLAAALGDVSPDRLNSLVRKDQRLNIRATAAEKADMQATAAALGLSLSEYVCGLHLVAGPRLAHVIELQPGQANHPGVPKPEKEGGSGA